jgi:hypothetical protein
MKINRCPVCGQRNKRSSEQNRLYWTLLHEIADKLILKTGSFSAEQWHLYFKQRFLGSDEVRLPNGKVIQIPKSTADLPVDDMSKYYTQVEVWASEHGVFLGDME